MWENPSAANYVHLIFFDPLLGDLQSCLVLHDSRVWYYMFLLQMLHVLRVVEVLLLLGVGLQVLQVLGVVGVLLLLVVEVLVLSILLH
jgi:hypothetical protein